jgi:tetratricopeptide (TPR) repeat protein
LNVTTVLEGSVRKAGGKVRVTAQLINTTDGYHIWSEVYDRSLEDIFMVQDELSRKIANILRQKLTIGESQESMVKSYTENVKAYNLYLKGNYFWNKWSPDSAKKAMDYYRRAHELEPEYPLPYSGLSRVFAFLGATGYMLPKIAYPKAKEYAIKALEKDDQISESHLCLAMVKLLFEWDWPGAEASFKKAINLSPGSAETYQYYRLYLNILGKDKQALEAAEKAYELDPLSLLINNSLADAYFMIGQFDEAIEQYKKTLDLDANFRTALYGLGWAYWANGDAKKSLQIFKQAQKETGHALKGITQLGYVYAKLGHVDKAKECLNKMKQRQEKEKDISLDMDFAVLYSGLNDYDKVFYHLEKAYEQRFGGLIFITGRHWAELKGDPRYRKLLQKMGL